MDVSQPSGAAPGDPSARKAIPAGSAPRASDADRERAAAVLQAATADGRVSAGELDERLGLVYSAKSKDELASIVKDLQPVPWPGGTPTRAKDIGVLSDFVRKGRWLVGDTYRGTAVISSGVIDLREAQFTGPETTIHVNSWIGSSASSFPKTPRYVSRAPQSCAGASKTAKARATRQRTGSTSPAPPSAAASWSSASSPRSRSVVSKGASGRRADPMAVTESAR